MAAKGTRKYEVYLYPDVVDIILRVSSEKDIQLDKAINQIIREWDGNKDFAPLFDHRY